MSLKDRLGLWRARRRASPWWTVVVAAIVAVMLLPVATTMLLALRPSEGTWWHLATTVLPRVVRETGLLMAGVCIVTLMVGVLTAWIVTMYRFPGHALVDRMLVLPLAMPTYIIAYAYVDLLDFTGPVQSALRWLGGWSSAGEYWFPQVRSTSGAVLLLSSALYPYVYLTARASFVQQSVCVLEVARTLGRTPWGTFRAVALPLAQPALAAGVALALMETLNDLGAVRHLGVDTLSAAIYATWLQRASLTGAAQIASVALLLVAMLFWAERLARGGGKVHHTTGRLKAIPFADLDGWRALGALSICAVPVVVGFVVPFLALCHNAFAHLSDALEQGFWQAAANSMMLAALAATAAVVIGVVLAYARRVAENGFTRPAVRIAGLGYALPGTVLALGLLIPLAAFDNWLDGLARHWLGLSTGLLLSGTLVTLVVAYSVRFLAVAHGTVEAGLERISPNLDAAARTLGETALSALRRVHLPLLLPALATAALLVFVDAMKELPATLLLRPFGFETLSTHVFALAALEQVEAASVGAVAIVLVGLVPVLLLHKAVADGRAGS
ncbi:MAG: iron ABC transporter permease [Hyphomicrobiaceae bacterium]|nr:iron ABC transporter permease [Hyphomicrobiaceae bacterium]